MSEPTFKTPAFVAHNRPATPAEYMRLNHAALSDPRHPQHEEASSDLRALSIQFAGANAHEAYTGDGVVMAPFNGATHAGG